MKNQISAVRWAAVRLGLRSWQEGSDGGCPRWPGSCASTQAYTTGQVWIWRTLTDREFLRRVALRMFCEILANRQLDT
jgi:hypothetical protein